MSTSRTQATRLIKKLGAVGVLSLIALAFPAAAQAHEAKATVSCTEAVFEYKWFPPGDNTVNWAVKVDGTTVESGTYKLDKNGGREGVLVVPLSIVGTHTVTAVTKWGPDNVEKGHTGKHYVKGEVVCEAPPPPPPTPPTPPVTPPAVTPPTPPAVAPVSAVQGVQVTSPARPRPAAAVAVLNTRSSCRSNVVRATVRGRGMRRVTFSINGRRVKTVRVRSGQRTVSTNLRRRSRGTQAITVRVQFANRTRTLTARAGRCAQAQVQPQFTG